MKPVSESIKFAIDTNIVSAFFKGEPDIGARVREAQQVYLPIIVLAELYFGAEKSPDPERKRQQIDRFLPLVEVLQTTAQTARKYGVIKAELEARGERIPDNDIWIAALAMEQNLRAEPASRELQGRGSCLFPKQISREPRPILRRG
jgi:tRNA(fMet)-specific endonuclease VapC